MKKLLLLIALITICNLSSSQNFTELDNYQFNTIESYNTEQNKVLNCANYLFENPVNKGEINRLISIQYIMKWMEGTPDYTFEIGEKAMELTNDNSDLLGLYLAAMSKVVLENEGEKLNSEEIYDEAERIIVEYCSNKENKLKPSKKIKKILKRRK